MCGEAGRDRVCDLERGLLSYPVSSECRVPVSQASASYSVDVINKYGLINGKEIRTTKLLDGDHGIIKLLVFVRDNLFILAFTDDDTRITPAELVHAPEGIDRQKEAVDGVTGLKCKASVKESMTRDIRRNIDDHPAHEHEFTFDDKYNGLRRMLD